MRNLTDAKIAAVDARFAAGETVWVWAIHHHRRVEMLTEPLSKRIAYVKANKPEREIPIRLRWMQPVQRPELLPLVLVEAGAAYAKAQAALDKAGAAYAKAQAALDKAWAAYAKAQAAYDKTLAAYDKTLAALDKAQAAVDKAWTAYDKAGATCEPELRALHEAECPGVPWDSATGLRFS